MAAMVTVIGTAPGLAGMGVREVQAAPALRHMRARIDALRADGRRYWLLHGERGDPPAA